MTAIARARAWLFDITAHHHAENLKTQRAVQRKAMGVPVEDLPYPGASVTNTTTTTTGSKLAGLAAPVLLGLLGLTGLGIAGAALLKPSAPAALSGAPAIPVPAAVPATAAQQYDAITEQQQADGTWQQIKRERLKP